MIKKRLLIVLLLMMFLIGCQKQDNKKVLNVLNWSAYIPDEVVHNFEK